MPRGRGLRSPRRLCLCKMSRLLSAGRCAGTRLQLSARLKHFAVHHLNRNPLGRCAIRGRAGCEQGNRSPREESGLAVRFLHPDERQAGEQWGSGPGARPRGRGQHRDAGVDGRPVLGWPCCWPAREGLGVAWWPGSSRGPASGRRAVPGAQRRARRSCDVGAADAQTQAGDTDGPAGGQSRASPQGAEGAILNLKASSVPTRHHHA